LAQQLRGAANEGTERSMMDKWDAFKRAIVTELRGIKKVTRKRTAGGFRQKIKRLKQVMHKCDTTTLAGLNAYNDYVAQLQTM
jgi:hypothetical protein